LGWLSPHLWLLVKGSPLRWPLSAGWLAAAGYCLAATRTPLCLLLAGGCPAPAGCWLLSCRGRPAGGGSHNLQARSGQATAKQAGCKQASCKQASKQAANKQAACHSSAGPGSLPLHQAGLLAAALWALAPAAM